MTLILRRALVLATAVVLVLSACGGSGSGDSSESGSDGSGGSTSSKSIDPDSVQHACDLLAPADMISIFPNLEATGAFASEVTENNMGTECNYNWGTNGNLFITFSKSNPGRTWDQFVESFGTGGCTDMKTGAFDEGMACPNLFGSATDRNLFQWQDPVDNVGVLLEIESSLNPDGAGDVDAGLLRIAGLLSDRST